MDLMEFAAKIAVFFVPMLFSLCVHEFAHGWVAKMKGDNTAEMMGRLTLNPIPHIDIMGTIILPMMVLLFNIPIFFGWAKPVPVNSRNLKNPRQDMFWIALAGPLSNLILATLGTVVIVLVAYNFVNWSLTSSMMEIIKSFIRINLFLAFFNAIPLHPLDGGKMLARFLPASLNYKLEQNEQISSMVLLVLIMTGALHFLAMPVMWTYYFLLSLAQGLVG